MLSILVISFAIPLFFIDRKFGTLFSLGWLIGCVIGFAIMGPL